MHEFVRRNGAFAGMGIWLACFSGVAFAQEVDATLDYRIQGGWLNSFWLRVRGSWINDETTSRDGTDIRVILRYDFPVI